MRKDCQRKEIFSFSGSSNFWLFSKFHEVSSECLLNPNYGISEETARMPKLCLDTILVFAKSDKNPYRSIHQDDINYSA